MRRWDVYRGRRVGVGRLPSIALFLLVFLLVVGATLFFALPSYLVYTKDSVELQVPWLDTEEAEEEDDGEGEEVVIYHLVGGENDETLEPIEDDEKLDEVFAEFCNQYEDFEDSDEAAALEPDKE